MADAPSATRKAFGDIAPALAGYTDTVLFGDVWERPGLSPRDRSQITVAALIALYRTNELPFHLKKTLRNGISREELIDLRPQFFVSGADFIQIGSPLLRVLQLQGPME